MSVIKLSSLTNRVALVTGSTSGIGLEVVKRLAAAGSHVIINGSRDPSKVTDTLDELKSNFKVKADYVPADLTKMETAMEMCENVRKIHPDGIDILINNAGFQHVSPITEFPIDKWAELLQVHLSTPFVLTRHFLPDMLSRGWGRIVNMGSAHSYIGSPNKAAYASAKHGLLGLTKVVALECAESGVVCNAICPGFVDTPILQQQVKAFADIERIPYDEARKKFLKHHHPSGEPVNLDHVADTIMFLCSDTAAQIQGSGLIMDGAWTAH